MIFLKQKALKANDNIAWLKMSFRLPWHQHSSDKSRSTEYPNGIAYIAIKQLTAWVIPAPEIAASILQMELDIMTLKEKLPPLRVTASWVYLLNKVNAIIEVNIKWTLIQYVGTWFLSEFHHCNTDSGGCRLMSVVINEVNIL